MDEAASSRGALAGEFGACCWISSLTPDCILMLHVSSCHQIHTLFSALTYSRSWSTSVAFHGFLQLDLVILILGSSLLPP